MIQPTWDKIINSGLISRAELARLMWPDIKASKIKLAQKIAGRAGQRLTDQDKALMEAVFVKEFS